MLLLTFVSNDTKDRGEIGKCVSMFEYWSVIGAPYSDNGKGRSYFYRRYILEWKYTQILQARNVSDSDEFCFRVTFYDKTMVII